MGVKHLWKLLEGEEESVPLHWRPLRGKVFAVDLSFWIVESQTATEHVSDPFFRAHLRTTFFRVKHLLSLGVRLVCVLDGAPPVLKLPTLESRGVLGNEKRRREGKKYRNSHFGRASKECADLLYYLGVPCVDLERGEAEAYCAHLNRVGLVDGVLTPDGDAFLFGATCIVRNYAKKESHLRFLRVNSSSFDSTTESSSSMPWSQRDLIALALLLGSDYTPGVRGIGHKTAVKMLDESVLFFGKSRLNGEWLSNLERWMDMSDQRWHEFTQARIMTDDDSSGKSKKNKRMQNAIKFLNKVRRVYSESSENRQFFREICDAYVNPEFSECDRIKLRVKKDDIFSMMNGRNRSLKWLKWKQPKWEELIQFGREKMQMEAHSMIGHVSEMVGFMCLFKLAVKKIEEHEHDNEDEGYVRYVSMFDHHYLNVTSIVKSRVQSGIEKYQCQTAWIPKPPELMKGCMNREERMKIKQLGIMENGESGGGPDLILEKEIFIKMYPEIVECFERSKSKTKSKLKIQSKQRGMSKKKKSEQQTGDDDGSSSQSTIKVSSLSKPPEKLLLASMDHEFKEDDPCDSRLPLSLEERCQRKARLKKKNDEIRHKHQNHHQRHVTSFFETKVAMKKNEDNDIEDNMDEDSLLMFDHHRRKCDDDTIDADSHPRSDRNDDGMNMDDLIGGFSGLSMKKKIKSKSRLNSTWMCSLCTFINDSSHLSCELCFTEKPMNKVSEYLDIPSVSTRVSPQKCADSMSDGNPHYREMTPFTKKQQKRMNSSTTTQWTCYRCQNKYPTSVSRCLNC